jgi:hypothetical protein
LSVVSRDPDEPKDEFVQVHLSTEGDETLLVVDQTGLPLDLVAAYGAGMQIHVEDLAEHLAGRGRVDAKKRFDELLPIYQRLAPPA